MQIRKVLFVILSVAVFQLFFSCHVQAETVDSGVCGANLTWIQTSKGELIISGSGDMYDYEEYSVPWDINGIEKVTINSGVTSIGNHAFASCLELNSVSLPEGMKKIGYRAFYNCGLESVYIPQSVSEIDTSVLAYSFRLKSIQVNSHNQYYYSDGKALYNKDKTILYQYAVKNEADYYEIPDTVTLLCDGSFGWSSNIHSLYVPSKCIKAEEDAFSNAEIEIYCFGTTELYDQYRCNKKHISVYNISSFEKLVHMSDVSVELDDSDCIFDLKAYEPEVTVKYGSELLTRGKDYDVEYTNNVFGGTAYAIIKGKKGFLGIKKVPFTIKGKSLESAQIEIVHDDWGFAPKRIKYTGYELKPELKVICDGQSLWAGEHFTVSYSNNINPGIATATIHGIGDYAGEKSIAFTIYDANANLDYNLKSVDGELVTTTATGKSKIIIFFNTGCGAPRSLFQCITNNKKVFENYDIIAINEDDATDEELKNYRDCFRKPPVDFCNDTEELIGFWYVAEIGRIRMKMPTLLLAFVDENNKIVNRLDTYFENDFEENFEKIVEQLFKGVPYDEIVIDTSSSPDAMEQKQPVGEHSKKYATPKTDNFVKENYYSIEKKNRKLKLKKSKITLCGGCKGEIEIKSSEGDVSYKSNNPSIATVSKYGVVKAKKKGNVDIVVTDDETGQQCICKVKVNEKINKKVLSKKIKKLKRKYSEGKKWSDKTRDKYGNTGCYAYMTKVTEYLYGADAKPKKHYLFNKIKVGDHIRIENGPHSLIVIEKRKNSVIVTEGNYYSSVHWGREITKSYLAKKDYYVETWY